MSDSFTQLLFHVVFSTKHRQRLVEGRVREELYPFIAESVQRHGGCLLAIGGMPDLHLLVQLRPSVSVSTLVGAVKTNSSRWLGTRPDLCPEFAWQSGYSAFSVNRSRLEAVVRYINNQESHHSRISSESELQLLMDRHDPEVPPG